MFALRSRIEVVARVALTVVMLFSALGPTTAAKADSLSASRMDPTQLGQVMSRTPASHREAKIADTLPKVDILYQADPPTEAPTAMQTPTVTDTADEALLVEPSPTPSPAAETTGTPEFQSTPTTETVTANQAAPLLSFNLLVSPEQATPGDVVTFTIEITNIGEIEAKNLQFSNVLPEELGNEQDGFKGFEFDPQTRTLRWTGADPLQPDQAITLQYSTRLDPQAGDESQVVVSAALSAEGLATPLTAKAVIVVLSAGRQFTQLGSQGGKAIGLNGRVQVDVPEGVLDDSEGIAIAEIKDNDKKAAGKSGLIFSLERLSSGEQKEGEPRALQAGDAEFDQPVELTVSFDGIADLATLGADYTPYLVTLDEASGTWVRLPLKSIDREANTIAAEIEHFSTWGAGIGPSFPQNGANILLFDSAYPSLFTGGSNFSIPIWTPPGRNGMGPALALSYSSGTANGVLGDIQAPWVGFGWSIDSVEIARKITSGDCDPCGGGSYGYKNEFLLTFNGTGYELIHDPNTPGRFHTKSESFLYIQRHNENLGNNTPAAQNASGEWWEVVETNGTRWRLGWNADSEQLAAMKGYPGSASGAWTSLGYGGHATDVVAARWRVDRVTDTHGNRMSFAYSETPRVVAGTSTNYDRASYMDTLTYTEHTSGSPAAGYSVVFVREERGGNDMPEAPLAWDSWDKDRLQRIEVKYGSEVVRTYDLGYDVRSYSDDGKSWETTTLTSVAISGDTTNAPTVTFSYVDKANRATCGTGCQEWAYPRLATISNGWGGSTTYTYQNDGRLNTSWYNLRVITLEISDGVNASPMTTTFAYSTPCYDDETYGWCNAGNTGELIGYGQTTVKTKAFDGTTTLAKSVHKFHTGERKQGREYEVQQQRSDGTILSQTDTTYTIATEGLPTDGYFTYASAVDEYVYNGASLDQISRTEYEYDPATGTLTSQKEYDGTLALYRQTDYAYVKNTSPSVWILNKVARQTLRDASSAGVSIQEYGYDGQLPVVGEDEDLTQGELTLSRAVNGTQTIDTGYDYDEYGNLTETCVYEEYGTTSSLPSAACRSYITDYDATLETYVISSDPPLLPATLTEYDYGLGVPTSVTDPNGNETTTAYDGLGRLTEITYPGYTQANVKYTYPSLPVSAPFALKAEMWDETIDDYRSAWQILDGLGRVIQTQSPYEVAGDLVLTDVSYNAQGLTLYQGLPRTVTGTGGSHLAPTWASMPHTTNIYDALGRGVSVQYSDGGVQSVSYSGLRTTVIDRNSHQKVQENDAFGRLVKVEEYTGSGPYTLYATTTYEYNVRDQLEKVTDAASNETTLTYGSFGRKDSMTDPDMGYWQYEYDVFGNLTEQTDARNCVTSVTYDGLNRPLTKSYSGPDACDNTPDVTYSYDATTGGNQGIGRRTGVSNANSASSWVYNALGQSIRQTQTIGGTDYQIDATFDAFSRPLTQTLLGSEVLDYSYNDMGTLSGLSNGTTSYASDIHYNPSGQVTSQQLGNVLLQQYCYEENTLRLSSLRVYSGSLQSCATSPSSPVLDLSYTYQPNGNVGQIVDATRSETLTFTYDELDRLDTVSGPYSHNYDYDPTGNITAKNTMTYTYGVTTHKHAVTTVNSGQSTVFSGTYDANGNMLTRVEGGATYTQTYDAENRLISVTVDNETTPTQFVYDGDGNLVKKIEPDLSSTIYVGGVYEVKKDSGGSITKRTTYYPAAGAMRVQEGTGNNVYYALKDHLGSASVMTDASGTVVGEQRYYPFGETRWSTGSMFTDKLYTGQREMAGLGIYHYGARFYSPRLGRFLSADTIVLGGANPQAFNRYSYVLNNPLVYIDPSGHRPCRSDYLCKRNDERRNRNAVIHGIQKLRAMCAALGCGPSSFNGLFSPPATQPGGTGGARNDMCDTYSCSAGVFTSGGGSGGGDGTPPDDGVTFSRKELIEMADKAERWQEFYTNTGTWIERGVGLGGSGVMLTIGGATCYPSFGLGCWMAGAATVEIMMMAHEVGRIGGYHQAENLGKINEYIEDLLIDDQRQQFTFHFKSDINHDLVLPGGTVLNSYEFYTISVDGYSETTSVDSRSAIIKIFGVEP